MIKLRNMVLRVEIESDILEIIRKPINWLKIFKLNYVVNLVLANLHDVAWF